MEINKDLLISIYRVGILTKYKLEFLSKENKEKFKKYFGLDLEDFIDEDFGDFDFFKFDFWLTETYQKGSNIEKLSTKEILLKYYSEKEMRFIEELMKIY